MRYYLDIKLKPDDDFPVYFLRNACFTKLHKALHTLNSVDIGVSFQKYDGKKLGCFIRLHGDNNALQTLQDSNWLGGLSGYCEVSDVLSVPDDVECYRTVSRIQPTMTMAKLKKRVEYQKANGDLTTKPEVDTYEKQYKAKMYAESLDNPYLELHSSSSHQNYRIFIDFGELQDKPDLGEFNHFGLSKKATIPWF